MQFLRSLLFAMLFYPATLIFVVAGLMASLAGPKPARRVVHGWAAVHRWLTGNLVGIRSRIDGAIPPGPHLIAVKHQAMYETIEMVLIAHTPAVVLKRELAELPLFGWMTRRYGVIPVDREAGARALRSMVAGARQAVAEQRSVVIYPEGTRVPSGTTPPLRPGFAGLYRALGLPVVPIAVDSGRLWGRGLDQRSGTVTFQVGETLPPGLPREEIEARVHAAINVLELAP